MHWPQGQLADASNASCSWLPPARQVGKQYQKVLHLSPSLREWSSKGAPVLLIPANQSCCPCPCFPDGGIWPGGVTVSTRDSEAIAVQIRAGLCGNKICERGRYSGYAAVCGRRCEQQGRLSAARLAQSAERKALNLVVEPTVGVCSCPLC